MVFHRQLFAAVIGALALSVVTPAVAQAAPARAVEYVNIGDSYSAGAGVLPLVPGSPAGCFRSQRNFAHLVAAQHGYRLTDVSCGGAETADFYRSQPSAPGTRPQLDALRPTTQVVTVMMGGNDSSTFAGSLEKCLGAAIGSRVADPCERRFGDSLIAPVFARTQPSLTRGLRAIRARSPRARIIVVGYPVLFPRSGSCAAGFLIAPGDTPYVRRVSDALNLAARRAAAAAGATYVDLEPSTEAHNACTGPGNRYVEPLIGATQFVPAHPNARGEAAFARQVSAAIDRR